MKSLVVAQEFPWPTDTGALYRLAKVVETLARAGDVHLFAFTFPGRQNPCDVPSGIDVRRLTTATAPVPDTSAFRRIRWWTGSGYRPELTRSDAASIRRTFDAWVDHNYDFAWYSQVAFEWLGGPKTGPTVVDLDLEDSKVRLRAASLSADSETRSSRERVRAKVVSTKEHLRAWRLQARQTSLARQVDRVTVCSEADRARLPVANVTVIPNGFDAPDCPLGRDEVGDPPTLLLPGLFFYGPNADAASWLDAEIFPLVRAQLPEARLRLVGQAPAWFARFDHRPAVTVVGHVDSMEPELHMADVVVVPIRYGSGTRVKILEAFAHRIPVVSTTIGAEGLGLEHGRHLLLADDAESFAQNCVLLLERPDLRRELVEAAHRIFLERHQWSFACDRIRALALDLAQH